MSKTRYLFGPKKVIENTNLEENFNDIESVRNMKAKIALKKRAIPRIDFATASNFAKFGSAELYYRGAMESISNQYPYDGSEAEQIEFLNAASNIDLYIFQNLYPRTNGYAIFSSNGWGSQASIADGYGRPVDQEYISVRGTMNTSSGGMIGKPIPETFPGSNIYDENPYDTLGLTDLGRQGTRTDNFLMDFERGVTVEFWMNKSQFITASTNKEVIFDLWNGESSGSDSYGRVTLFLSGTTDGSDPFRLNLYSGSSGFQNVVLNTGQTTSSLADGNWHHYAVSIKNPTNEDDRVKVYLDGALKATITSSLGLGDVTGGINARIGALLTAPSGSSAVAGAGKLSASLDEFRYWKAERSTENIAKYYRTNVFGGTNTDISNTELGAYYKFNEGKVVDDNIDSIVLDYSGRISNGKWTGYPGSSARATGSAMVLAGVTPFEYKDPIIYTQHPDYISTFNELAESGSFYDSQNPSLLINTFPDFVINEDTGELKQLVQIIANAYDEIYLQMQEMNRTKDVSYGGVVDIPEDVQQKAFPFIGSVLQSIGLDTNELFNNESLLEFIRNRNDVKIYEQDLTEVKNEIYKNIYNNAVHLLKTKGTQKSVRNFLRTIGVSERVVELKGYSSNRDYTIEDRFENNVDFKKYISFDSASLLNATIFQTASSNANARGQFYITGAQDASSSLSAEVNVFFPRKKETNETGYYTTNFLTSSIFGFHLLDNTGSYDFSTSDNSFQLIAVRPFEESRDAYFAIKNANGIIYCSSSLYKEVYTGNEWTFAVSVYNDEQDYGAGVSGSSPSYLISLSGYNTEGYFVKDNFSVSGSLTTARATLMLTTPKTYFAGADRTNFSGTVLTQTDVEIGHIRHYDNVALSQEAIEAHAKDRNIFGTSRATKNFSLFSAGTATGSYIPEASTILFNVDFQTVTGSDSSGEFLAIDFASGSTSATDDIRNNYDSPYGDEFATQYEFKGFGFPASSTTFVDNKTVIGSDVQFPEQINASDLVKVLTSDDEVFTRDFSPETLYYSLEKSFAGAFSREMVDFIGNVTEFNNIIGEAGALYREEYNHLDNLRSLFFQRIKNVKDFNKFYDYYKWFDDSIYNFILQLVPETANLRLGMQNIIESHILERDKVLTPYPQFRQVVEDTNTFGATLQGINDLDYNWKFGHAPVSDATDQSNNAVWWKQRAERTGSVGSGDQEVNEDIAAVKLIQQNRNLREYRKNFTAAGTSYFKQDSQNNKIVENISFGVEQDRTIFGGLNNTVRKDIGLLRSIVSKFADADSDVRIRSDFTEILTINDDVELKDKRKRLFDIQSFDGDLGPEVSNFVKDNVEIVFPGNILSASYKSPSVEGYNSGLVVNNLINIGNIHLDYGLTNEIPMQGVFTEAHVGGLQYRHNDLNTSSATTERPEGYKIGYNASLQRVFLGPPQSDNTAITSVDTNLPYAPWTRDEGAKRPINIRNIKYGTGSQVYGNYRYEYNLLQLNGRITNNPDFIKAEGFGTGSLTSSFITGVVDYTKPTRPARKQIIVNRFSAPGDPLTAGDNQGGVGLDYEAAELSPYSHMNYRNLVTRLPLNNIFLVNHAVSGGFSSDQNNSGSSLYNPSSVTSSNYLGTSSVFGVGVPSFHKTQRAGHLVRYSGSADDFGTGSGASDTTKTLYDNYYVVSSLPGTELRYAWITSSYESSYVLGYQTPTGEVSTSAGVISEIVFTSGSDQNSSLSFVGANLYVITDDLTGSVPTIDTNTLTVTFPSTSSTFVNDFILNTNGPYGYPTFKQVRVGEGRVNRYLRANNLFAYPVKTQTTLVDPTRIVVDDITAVTTQSVITCRYDPVEFSAVIEGQEYILNIENGNQKILFSQDAINNSYQMVEGSNESTFDNMIGAFTENNSFILNGIKYRETVWPSEENSYLEKVRERVGFVSNFWRDDAQNRSDDGPLRKPYGVRDDDSLYLRSVWDLDVFRRFELASFKSGGSQASGINTPGANTAASPANTRNPGILQNFTTYNKYKATPGGVAQTGSAKTLNVQPTYARNHFMQEVRSVVSPHGLDIELSGGTKISSFDPSAGGSNGNIYSLIGSGFAKWEADTQAGIFTSSNGISTFMSKSAEPFYDTYDEYNLDIKTKRKDLSIIPEYISSDFVGTPSEAVFDEDSFSENFKIKQANPSSDLNRPLLRGLPQNSSQQDFFKIYSHSDLMKYFGDAKEGASDNDLEPATLTLKFRGIKKFLPYNGFFPAERSAQIVEQFFNTYGTDAFTVPDEFITEEVSDTNQLRPIMQTLFAPGLLYNSIKSGMAVDYPIFTESYTRATRPLSRGINKATDSALGVFLNRVTSFSSSFDQRLDFETLYKPSLLNGLTIVDNDDTQFTRINGASTKLRNQVDILSQNNLYTYMINNYLAESVGFFLKDSRTTRILSQPQADFGEVTPGRPYGMRIKMYRSLDRPKRNSGSYGNYPVPQILSQSVAAPAAYIYINKGLVAGTAVPEQAEGDCTRSSKDPNWDSAFTASFTLSGATAGSWTITGNSDDVGDQDSEYDAAGNVFQFSTDTATPAPVNYQTIASNLVSVISLHPSYSVRSFDATIDYTTLPQGADCATADPYDEFVVVEVTSKVLEDGISLAVSNSATPDNTENGLNNFFFISSELVSTIDESITTQTDDAKARIGTGSFSNAGTAAVYSRPTLNMYSRPSAFGPPTIGMEDSNEAATAFSGAFDSLNGHNLPFTPPYYDGEAWIDVIYVPQGTSISGSEANSLKPFKPVISGDPQTNNLIFNFPDDTTATARQDGLFVKHWRFDKDAGVNPGEDLPARDGNLNSNAMQLSASVNAFETVGEGDNARWSIELKFETPILNFNHLASYDSVTQPDGELSASVPRGMWHQFGRMPNENEGVYLSVEPIPDNWLFNHPSGTIGTGRDGNGIGADEAGNAYTVRPFGSTTVAVSPLVTNQEGKPLNKICGFPEDPVKLGNLKAGVTVREAIVAIPFRNIEGTKQLFNLASNSQELARVRTLVNSINDATSVDSLDSVGRQIQKMKRYHFPPYLDFINYPSNVDPYSAYIFEFEHTFDKNDLSYIWQNLTPPSGQVIEEVEQEVTHTLTSRQLLGKYSNAYEKAPIEEDMQWMVFKVKQKARTDYEKDILGRSGTDLPAISEDNPFGYNWPYDHFSLVEMGKLDVDVSMLSTQVVDNSITAQNAALQALGTNFGDVLGQPDPDPTTAPAFGQTLDSIDDSRPGSNNPVNTGGVNTNLPNPFPSGGNN
jgi:hypothetical protein